MGRLCFCNPCQQDNLNKTCELKAESKCYAAVKLAEENGHKIEVWSYGCLGPEEPTILQVILVRIP